MRNILILLVALLGVTTTVQANLVIGPGAPTPLTGTPYQSDNSTRFSSPRGNQQATTGFFLSAGQDMLQFTFWGQYQSQPPAAGTDTFELRIWGPPTGLTSNVSEVITTVPIVLNSSNLTRTAETSQIFRFDANFFGDPIDIDLDGLYYFSVVDTNPATTFSWLEYANVADGRYARFTDTDMWMLRPNSLSFQSLHVPEPSSIVLMSLAGGCAVVAVRRKKRRQANVEDHETDGL